MAYTQAFAGGSGSTGDKSPFFYDTGAYVECFLSIPAGNVNLSGNRPVRINSISPYGASGTYSIAVRLGGTLYAAGTTIANSTGTDGVIRLTKTGGSEVGFRRAADAATSDTTLYNSGGTATFTWDSAITGSYTWFTVPSTPASLTVSSVVGTTVNLTYGGSSSDGGEAIDSYSAQYSSNGGSSWTGTKTVSGGSFSFTGLTPGTTYQFRVYANNAAGSSAARTSASVLVATYGKRATAAGTGSWTDITIARRATAPGTTNWEDITIARRSTASGTASWTNLT